MADQITGYVNRVVFHREDFYILTVAVHSSTIPGTKRIETVRGNLFGLIQVKAGVPLQLEGAWQEDPKYGPQLVFKTWQPWARTSEEVALFLHTCVEGFVDVALADLVADTYGVRAFDQLSNRPVEVQKLFRANDINEDDAQDALLGWQQTLASRDLSELLREGGLGAFDVQAAILRFGSEAPTVLRDNPYRLMEIPTLSFPKVDRLAKAMGVAVDDLRRVEGAIMWGIHTAARSGHTYVGRNEIMTTVEDLFRAHHLVALTRGEAKPVFLGALRNLIARKTLILDPKAGLYAPELHHFERKSAEILANLLVPSALNVDLQPFLSEYERVTKITLSDAQRRAVECLTENRVLVLTGLPGTGKTTAIRVLVRAFEAAQVDFALMAPTGIASKRLSTVTGHAATTIHRGLKFNGMTWGHHEHNRLMYDAVILDEVSMVDQELIYRLLVALRPDVRLVLVGDDAQLPSVGPGNVLRELADCACVPNVRLTQIFRQSAKGEIVVNAHRINRGEMVQTESDRDDTEFKFVRMSDELEIQRLVVEMAARLKAKDANFQVMTAKYDGVVGVNNLNEKLRDRLNPVGPQEWKRGDQHFRLGDRVMVVQNDYRRGVYNGDVGKLVFIDRNQLIVRIHDGGEGADMEVEFDDAAAEGKLRLAYAVTVHKSQGNEFDTVILPIVASQGRMLQRNLLYTAVTRARKRVWLIGEEAAIQKAVANNQVVHRNTALGQAILDAVTVSKVSGVLGEDEPGRSKPQDNSSGPESGSGATRRTDAQAEGDAKSA